MVQKSGLLPIGEITTYRKTGIRSRLQICRSLGKIQFLLSKFWAKISSQQSEAAASNTGFTVYDFVFWTPEEFNKICDFIKLGNGSIRKLKMKYINNVCQSYQFLKLIYQNIASAKNLFRSDLR